MPGGFRRSDFGNPLRTAHPLPLQQQRGGAVRPAVAVPAHHGPQRGERAEKTDNLLDILHPHTVAEVVVLIVQMGGQYSKRLSAVKRFKHGGGKGFGIKIIRPAEHMKG